MPTKKIWNHNMPPKESNKKKCKLKQVTPEMAIEK